MGLPDTDAETAVVEPDHTRRIPPLSEVTEEDPTALAGYSSAPDAVVYVPGMRLQVSDERTFEGVAERLTAACDKQAASPAAVFTRESRTINTNVGSLHKATIVRHDGSDSGSAVVDVYEFPWARAMRKRWEQQSSRARVVRGAIGFGHGVRLTGHLIINGVRLPAGVERRRRLGQALIALVALLIVFAYIVLVLSSAIAAIAQIAEDDPRLHIFQQVSLISTGVVAVLIPSLRNQVPAVGAGLLAVSDYVRLPDEPTRISGELTRLLEWMQENDRHERIHLLGYSMGSIVAFDTLHPTTGQVRTLKGVHRLVTIGPLFDLVRATRRNYFDGRTSGDSQPKWVSYWSVADLLSSPAPRPKKGQSADVAGVEELEIKTYNLPMGLGFWNMVALYGFKSHGLYWGDDGVADNNIFDQVVTDLFPASESDVLA